MHTELTFAGQAGFILKSRSGQTLGIDLYLSDCVERVEGHCGYHRLQPRIFVSEDLGLDFLIATHFHRDHFDIDAIPKIMASGRTFLLCAKDCVDDVQRLGLDNARIRFVQPGDRFTYGDFDITFTRCDHGEGAPLAVGVLIRVDGKNVLEVGDTCLHLDWKNDYLAQGSLDVLIAPINGKYGNMDERENIELTKTLQPKLTIPCHFGMFASHGGDPGVWKELVEESLPKQAFKLFTLGETIII